MLSFFSIFYHLFYHLYALSPFHSAQHSILSGLLQEFILCAAQYSGYSSMHVCVLSWFSHVQLFATPWTAAHQVSMSMESSRQEYWSGLPCPPPGDLSDPSLEPISPASPALQTDTFTTEPPGSPYSPIRVHNSLSKVPGHAGSKVGNTHTQDASVQASLVSFSKSRDRISRSSFSLGNSSFHSHTEVFLWKSNLTLQFKV